MNDTVRRTPLTPEEEQQIIDEGGAVARPYTPTAREKLKYRLAQIFEGVGPYDQYESMKMAEKVTGNPNATDDSYGVGLLDFTPAGAGFAIQEGSRTFERGRNSDDEMTMLLGIGEAALGALEALPLTKPLVKGAAKGLERLSEAGVRSYREGTVGSNFGNLPPAENARLTQITGTFPTYEKADALFDTWGVDGNTLDFGAGKGMSTQLGYDTYEPFPSSDFEPTFMKSDAIPDNSYNRVVSLNVLNVVPRETRDEIVSEIGRVLEPGGNAIITTRGRDVLSAKGEPGPEDMSIITSRNTYQKGFTQAELMEYVKGVLGDGFEVEPVRLGPAGVRIVKSKEATASADVEMEDILSLRAAEMEKKPSDRLTGDDMEPLFETTPEAYERTMPEQSVVYSPRLPEGSNKALPKNDRARPVWDMREQIADRLAERMEPWVGTEAQYFYHTGPIIDKAVELGYTKEEAYAWLRDFADAYAATSPRTRTDQNLRNATLAIAKRERGVDIADILGPGGDGVNEKGYPMMIGETGIHRRLLDALDNGGINPDTNPKPFTFAENVAGNLDGVTVDTHAIRGALDAMNEISPGSIPEAYILPQFREAYRANPADLDPATWIDDTLGSQKIDGNSLQTEYSVFSDIYRLAAERLGVLPAEAQSLGWFGSGDRTGLASDLASVVTLLDERIGVTAKATGISKEEVFRKLLSREIPLMSFLGAGVFSGTDDLEGTEE